MLLMNYMSLISFIVLFVVTKDHLVRPVYPVPPLTSVHWHHVCQLHVN